MSIDSKKIAKSEKDISAKEECIDDNGSKKNRLKILIIHGEKYKTTLSRKYENRKRWEKPNPKHIVSFIPGTVNELFIREGEKVNKGDRMLILESMKMLNTFEVPADGKIGKINIKKGDKIPKGCLMIEFE